MNFSHVINSFKQAGVKEVTYKTQLQALIDFGIIELLEILKEQAGETAYLKETQKVKTLLEPTGMGDRFKMLQIRQ